MRTNYYRGNISSRFSRNSEAFASELLENLEEMFPLYMNVSELQLHNNVLPVARQTGRF